GRRLVCRRHAVADAHDQILRLDRGFDIELLVEQIPEALVEPQGTTEIAAVGAGLDQGAAGLLVCRVEMDQRIGDRFTNRRVSDRPQPHLETTYHSLVQGLALGTQPDAEPRIDRIKPLEKCLWK